MNLNRLLRSLNYVLIPYKLCIKQKIIEFNNSDLNYFIKVGGVGVDGDILRTIEIFDTISGSWNEHTREMKYCRTNHSVTCQNGVLYIVSVLYLCINFF